MPCRPGKTRKVEGSRGFTFIEMLIALGLTVLAFSAFLGVALETVQDYELYTTVNLLSQWNQQVINDVRDDTLSAKQYFENDAGGLDYLAALDLPISVPPIDTLTLPVIDEEGLFEKDTVGAEKTGNALFFAKTMTPFETTVQLDASTTGTFRINVYSLVLYYISVRRQDAIGVSPDSLDLIRWAGIRVADYGQVMAIKDPDPLDLIDPRAQLVADFVTQTGSTFLWDSMETVDQAFYSCNDTGFINGTPEANMVVPNDPADGLNSMIPGGIRQGKRTSIFMNNGTPGFQGGPRVPRYAILDATNDGFPHGFEVQVVGPSNARKLLVHIAMAKEGSKGLIGKEFEAILTTRDF